MNRVSKPSPLYDALAELVKLKSIKNQMELMLDSTGKALHTPSDQEKYEFLLSTYTGGKAQAWATAASLLETAGWVLAKQHPPEPDRAILMTTGYGEILYGHFDRRLGPHDGSGAYAVTKRGKRSTTIEEVSAVVAWTYVQLPPASLFE